MQYEFRRDFYNLVKESLNQNAVSFLLGTRKCGKTVCLKQLNEELSNSVYIDFKTLNEDEKLGVFDEVIEAIKNNVKKTFLLDEITYVKTAELEICKIANSLADINNSNTKIVLTGSQSVALEAWANRAFAGNVGKIRVDFLTYSEFLRYKNIDEVSAETYNQFLFESADFYQFTSLEDYLKGCLEETIISNNNTSNYIFDNDCYLLKNNVDFLIDVCYQTLFTLHNQANVQTFFKDNKLRDTIVGTFRDVCKELNNRSVAEKIENSFIGSYNSIRSKELEMIKQAFLFLKKCDLITITPLARDLENIPDINRDLHADNSRINYKDELFKSFNISIKYPMFYVQILKDVLQEDMPDKLPGIILGSIVECHAKGLLPQGFEFKAIDIDDNGNSVEKEVDYVNLSKGIAVELTIQAKHKTCFEKLPDYLNCSLLTRDKNNMQGTVKKIAYYDYLYDLSKERYFSLEKSNNVDMNRTPKTKNHVSDLQQDENVLSGTVGTILQKVKKLKAEVKEMLSEHNRRIESSFQQKEKRIKKNLEISR